MESQNVFPLVKFSCFCLSRSRVLSALAHWAAIFGEVEYLPLVAFPFVKLFQNNAMLCFEVVATVIGTLNFHLCLIEMVI